MRETIDGRNIIENTYIIHNIHTIQHYSLFVPVAISFHEGNIVEVHVRWWTKKMEHHHAVE